MRLRSVIGAKESGYISATGTKINRQQAGSHLMAVENDSQLHIMNSDIDSTGGRRYSQLGLYQNKQAIANNNVGFYPNGYQSASGQANNQNYNHLTNPRLNSQRSMTLQK